MFKKDENPYVFSICPRIEIKDFLETYHYLHNMNGVDARYSFKITKNGKLVGAIVFGRLAMASVWKKYVNDPYDILELRRLCILDEEPQNVGTWFVAQSIRFLKHNTQVQKLIAYADTTMGHEGTVYKAGNWKYVGHTKGDRHIVYDSKRYHDKTIRTYHNGQLKPFAKKIKQALEDGTAHYKKGKPKNTFIYEINRKQQLILGGFY